MTITIYSTSICPSCHSLKKWLDRQGHAYEAKITDTDEVAMKEFMELNDGAISVPFSIIRDNEGKIFQKISGFDQKAFKQALSL